MPSPTYISPSSIPPPGGSSLPSIVQMTCAGYITVSLSTPIITSYVESLTVIEPTEIVETAIIKGYVLNQPLFAPTIFALDDLAQGADSTILVG